MNKLLSYLERVGLKNVLMYPDGAFLSPGQFPLAGAEARGAVLFADLPGYSRVAAEHSPAECAYFVNHFFAWFEAEMKGLGGVIDKFIGDEIMVVFLPANCSEEPVTAAVKAAHRMLDSDSYGFAPKIGVAEGPLFVACVGTKRSLSVTALGHTVNVAARMVSGVKAPQTLRVGAELSRMVADVFGLPNPRWELSDPFSFSARNIGDLEVVDVVKHSITVKTFDYWADAAEAEKLARDKGAIVVDDAAQALRSNSPLLPTRGETQRYGEVG